MLNIIYLISPINGTWVRRFKLRGTSTLEQLFSDTEIFCNYQTKQPNQTQMNEPLTISIAA